MSYDDYDERISQMIASLVERTRADTTSGNGAKSNRLEWEAVNPDCFELTLTRNSLRIKSEDNDGQPPYVFQIIDDQGRIIEEVSDRSGGGYQLADLYRAASRSFRKIDERLDEIMKELDIPEPPPRRRTILDDPWGSPPSDTPPF